MLFSQIIPPLPSPIEPKSLFYTSVSLFLSAYDFHLEHGDQRPFSVLCGSMGVRVVSAGQALFLTSVPYSVSLFSLLQVCESIRC